MIPLRLLEHNIERATGLTVGAGRAKRSVTLAISGTSSQMTVDAAELVEAVLDIMSRPPVRTASTSTRKNKRKVAVRVRQDGQHSPAVKRPVKRQSATPERAQEPTDSAKILVSADGTSWTAYQDRVIRIVSPAIAAEKLGRPVSAIQARRDELGLKSLSNRRYRNARPTLGGSA